jgi:hypothetical protein
MRSTATAPTRNSTSTVVVTRLRARGPRGVLAVVRRTGEVVAQCRAVDGYLGGRVAVDPRGLLWTLTVWASPQALRTFSASHAPVAAGIDEVASDSAMTAYRQSGAAVPTWADAAASSGLGRPWLALHRSV